MPTEVGIHAFGVFIREKAWMPTDVGMTSLDHRRRVNINGVWH